MKRSTGVTVIAVLALLGSIFTLLMAILMVVIAFVPIQERSPSPIPVKLLMLFAAAFYLLPTIWGLVTSVGLFRLKEWARISTIVFSVLLILMSVFGGLGVLVAPNPPTPNQPVNANVLLGVRLFMTLFVAGMSGIGIWWIVFLTRARVKQQFAPAHPVTPGASFETPGQLAGPSALGGKPAIPARPVSLTVIAWLVLWGCLFLPISILLHYPAAFFTTILNGWPATIYYLAFLVVHLYVGIGLLRFNPLAATVGAVYYGFVLINMFVFNLAPGGRSRMMDLMQKSVTSFPWLSTEQWQNQISSQSSMTPFLVLGTCLGLITISVPLYFLITRKKAFEEAAAAKANAHFQNVSGQG